MAQKRISPYIREGSGLKRVNVASEIHQMNSISPYIREGSGLKRLRGDTAG